MNWTGIILVLSSVIGFGSISTPCSIKIFLTVRSSIQNDCVLFCKIRFVFCDGAYGKQFQTDILSLLRHQALLLHARVCGLHHWLLREAARNSEQGRNESERGWDGESKGGTDLQNCSILSPGSWRRLEFDYVLIMLNVSKLSYQYLDTFSTKSRSYLISCFYSEKKWIV